jgi:adenylate kinase
MMTPSGTGGRGTAARDVRAEVRAIRERMKCGGHPLIILVSGVHGIGKTTLSHELSRRLGIRQRVGLGAIVKTLIEFGLPADAPGAAPMMDNVLDLEDPASQLDAHARVICRVVDRLVRTYHAQDVHCVIDGVQLLPRYLHLSPDVIHLHLAVSDFSAYIRQVRRSASRKYGEIEETTARVLETLDRVLAGEMHESREVVILPHRRPVGGVVAEAIRVIHERYVQRGGCDLCSGNE